MSERIYIHERQSQIDAQIYTSMKKGKMICSPSQVKKCRICGDDASAFNFNGLSCESCKSFFRRNANKDQKLECQKQGSCVMTIKTRKFCSKCRLDRCFEIGMKKELIYKRKQAKVQSDEDKEVSFIKSELLNAFNAGTNPIFPVTTSDSQYPALNSYERMKIEEIIGYYRDAFKEENTMKPIIDETNKERWMKNAEEYCKHLVRTVKNIPGFRNFDIDDKLVLIKNFIVLFFDIRFCFFYDKERDTTLLQQTPGHQECYRVSMNLWDEWVSQDFYEEWKTMMLKFKTAMMNDPIIRDLIITMALFREHDKIRSAQWMRYKYLESYYLFKRYIQVKLKSKERFERHMKHFHRLLIELPVLIEFTRRFYKIVSPHHTNAILDEIYQDLV